MDERTSPHEDGPTPKLFGFTADELARLLFLRHLYQVGRFQDDSPPGSIRTAESEVG